MQPKDGVGPTETILSVMASGLAPADMSTHQAAVVDPPGEIPYKLLHLISPQCNGHTTGLLGCTTCWPENCELADLSLINYKVDLVTITD